MAYPAKDLTGQQFGYLTVLRREGTSTGKSKKATWRCRCDCGAEVVRESQSLRSSHRSNPRHCGCRMGEFIVKHHMSCTRPYLIWVKMRKRCTNPMDKDFKNYGARGITVHTDWAGSFDAFWKDMSEGYEEHLTLGRIDNDGPYTPQNCRWETPSQQGNNRRTNIHVETPAGRMTVTEASRHYGVGYQTLRARLLRGWPVLRALTDPIARKRTTS